jgi:hypothetical protein
MSTQEAGDKCGFDVLDYGRKKMQYYFRTSFFERNFTMTFRLQRTEGEVLLIGRNYLWRRVLKQRQSCPFRLREVIRGGAEV